MSNNPTLDDAKRKLDELEQRIQAARAQHGAVSEADKDWQDMVRAHTEMQRKLDAAKDHSANGIVGRRTESRVTGGRGSIVRAAR